ncbi:YetF domain-containing protein [Weizmannia acidilactici]
MLKWPWFRKLINHRPITIVQNGEILYKGLKKARIFIDV